MSDMAGKAARVAVARCGSSRDTILQPFGRCQKKAPRITSGALSCCAANSLFDYDIVRIAGANHPLRIYKAVHVNRDPTVVHEHEVRAPD